jgi:DEAD/DEAH box helicase domain-containing protein
VFVTTSATLGNPDEFLRRLTGEAFEVIAESGAPAPPRWFALIKPRANAYTETCELLALMLKKGLKTITFTKARKITELLTIWLAERAPALATKVRAYRAGYLPEERRELERALSSDELSGIISTSALELGIDIGGLDGCLLTGFPGTMLSTWQRAGRVGRGGHPALIALVGMDDALDLYFLSHPKEFFARPPERLLLDEANPAILKAHLACAAAEEPLTARDAAWFGPTLEARVAELLQEGRLFEAAGERRWFCPLKAPQRHVNIRGAGESFVIEDETGKLLGTVDGIRVFRECHPFAIYLHAGETWEVTRLDTDARRVKVRPVTVDHYTQAVATETTRILAVRGERPFGPGRLCWGDVRVTTRIVEYERKRVRGGEVLSRHPLDLPPQEFETTAVWLVVPDGVTRPVQAAGRHLMGALHALEHVSIALFPLFALCDRWDLGGISTTEHADTGTATIFIYDGMPGGVGLAELAFGIMEQLQSTVASHLAACPCENGCPSCVHSPKCGSRNYPLDKVGALMLATTFVGEMVGAGRALAAAGSASPGAFSGTEAGGAGRVERPLIGRSEVAAGPDLRRRGAAAGGGSAGGGVPPATPATEDAGGEADPAAGRARPAPRPPVQPGHTVVFDLETQKLAEEVGGWDNKRAMRMSVGCVYDVDEAVFRDYREEEVGALIADLSAARLVVGFNVKSFDYEVLAAYAPRETLDALPTLDLLEKVRDTLKRRVRLDDLAKATLGRGKIADGLDAVRWFRAGEFDRLIEYCRHDVVVTKDLFEFGRAHGHVLFPSIQGVMKLPASW